MFASFADFYQRSRYGQFPQEHRQRADGALRAFVVDQEAHDFIDPACGEWILGIPLRASCPTRFDYGEGWQRGRRNRGDMLLVPPRTEVRYEITGPTRLLVLTWSEAALREVDPVLFGSDASPFKEMIGRYVRNVFVERVAKSIWHDLSLPDPASRILLEGALLQLVGAMLRCTGLVAQQRPLRRLDVRRAVDYIHANYMHDLSLRDIAREAQLSVFHFSRAFRMQIGQSPFSYLQSRRLDVAEALLRQPKVDLEDVARRSGFQNARRLRAALRAKGNR